MQDYSLQPEYPDKDILVSFDEVNSRHIVVQRGPRFYAVKVINDDGSIVSKSALLKSVGKILNGNSDTSSDPIGLLTTMNRDRWASARDELISISPSNEESLKMIDSALFAVCLEDKSVESYDDISSCMLHGDARNRWFDKSFQLIVTKNGKAAVTFEHAWGDGVAVLRYFNTVFDDLKGVEKLKSGDLNDKADSDTVRELRFELNSSLKKTIADAGTEADKFIASLDLATIDSSSLTKSFCKKSGVGADGVLQMTFQLAHHLMHDSIKATYESASTSAFKHGRTETIRPATAEAKEFLEVFKKFRGDGQSGLGEKKNALIKTVKNHGRITKDALMGKGIDRHLFALKNVAEQTGKFKGTVADFFTDKTMQDMNHWVLSTSTLTSPALYAGGFGPVNADCYGIAYGISDEGFRSAVTSYQRDSKQFTECMEKAAKEIREALEYQQK